MTGAAGTPTFPDTITSVNLPQVVVIGTGGTIAGRRSAAHGNEYASAVTAIDDIVAAVPGIERLADVRAEQLFQVDSVNMSLPMMIQLARRVDELLQADEVAGIVVAHGTDTLEESAFLLNLVINSDKPVVLCGSMRPADAISADGPDNLYDAIAVAAHPRSVSRGVLVAFDDQVFAARDVRKANTTRTDAFQSPYGALGEVVDSVPRFVRTVTRAHTTSSAFSIDDLGNLPRVETIHTHPEMSPLVLDALVDAGVAGLVHVGPGNGNISTPILAKLDELTRRGVIVVRASRVGSGVVTRNGAGNDDAHGFVAADDHTAPKARILLSLALTKTHEPKEIQRLFWQH